MSPTGDDSNSPVGRWLSDVAGESSQPIEVVQDVLSQHGVRAQTTLPRPHRLLVTDIKFDGIRPPGTHDAAGARNIPFSFHWRLGPGLWGLASSGMNEAGKSSVLEVILWCLRGRSGLQRDVQSWLRNVRLGFDLDGERLVVQIKVTDGRPSGTVISLNTDANVITFDNARSFEAQMDDFMLGRLGLEPLRTQQKRPGGVEGPPLVGELSWPAYASALHINRAGLGQLLGNETRNALPTRLLELFIGAPWASTMVSASVAQKIVAAKLSAARDRARENAEEHQARVNQVKAAIEVANEELLKLPEAGKSASDQIEAYRRLTEATEKAGKAQQALLEARTHHDELEEQRHRLVAAAHAVKEAELAKAFFHTLRPTVCPRCDAKVTAKQWAQEENGHCSLCTSELNAPDIDAEDTTDEQDVDDVADLELTLSDTQASVNAAASALEKRRAEATAATEFVRQAEADLQQAQTDPTAARRGTLSLEIARLRGVLDERSGVLAALGDPSGIAPLERDNSVLKAAEKAAHKRRTAALKDVIEAVEQDILTMGRQLGLDMLEAVKLGTSTTLTVFKGGQQQPYGSLTEGEQLRLKIVTTTALLRNGIRTGVGRHPGLLIIDSPGAEEVDRDDLQLMVSGLAELTKSAPELQIIIATARGQEVASVIDDDHLRLAPPGERLW